MDTAVIPVLWRLTAWALLAFALWMAFAWLFARLALPSPQVGAAVLAWVAAGLVLPWVLLPAMHWGRHALQSTEMLLGIH